MILGTAQRWENMLNRIPLSMKLSDDQSCLVRKEGSNYYCRHLNFGNFMNNSPRATVYGTLKYADKQRQQRLTENVVIDVTTKK